MQESRTGVKGDEDGKWAAEIFWIQRADRNVRGGDI